MDLLLQKFTVFEEKLDSNIAAVSQLKSEVQQLKDGNSDILHSVDNMEGKVSELAEDVNDLRQKMKRVETVNTAVEERIKELENIAETELVRTECLVNKYLEGKMVEVIEKCREAAWERTDTSTDEEVEAVSVVERIKKLKEERDGTVKYWI